MPILDLGIESIEWSRYRSGDNLSVFVKYSVVAGAEEFLAISNPADAAAKVSTDIRHGYEFAPILSAHINTYFLFVHDP